MGGGGRRSYWRVVGRAGKHTYCTSGRGGCRAAYLFPGRDGRSRFLYLLVCFCVPGGSQWIAQHTHTYPATPDNWRPTPGDATSPLAGGIYVDCLSYSSSQPASQKHRLKTLAPRQHGTTQPRASTCVPMGNSDLSCAPGGYDGS